MVAKYITLFLLSFTLAGSVQALSKTQVDTAAGSPSPQRVHQLETSGDGGSNGVTTGSDGNVYISRYTDGSLEEASQGTKDAFVGESHTDASMKLAQFGLVKFVFELFNVDDEAKIYLNNEQTPLLTKDYFEEGAISIFPGGRIYDGDNTVRLEVYNKTGGWTYGLRVSKKSLTGEQLLIDVSCGQVGVYGCVGDDEDSGLVFSKTYTFKRY